MGSFVVVTLALYTMSETVVFQGTAPFFAAVAFLCCGGLIGVQPFFGCAS